MDGRVVVIQVSTRMAPAPAGGRSSTEGASRTTFAVGKISRRRSEIRSVAPKAGLKTGLWSRRGGGAETVH
jgi:hypothetical protein